MSFHYLKRVKEMKGIRIVQCLFYHVLAINILVRIVFKHLFNYKHQHVLISKDQPPLGQRQP